MHPEREILVLDAPSDLQLTLGVRRLGNNPRLDPVDIQVVNLLAMNQVYNSNPEELLPYAGAIFPDYQTIGAYALATYSGQSLRRLKYRPTLYAMRAFGEWIKAHQPYDSIAYVYESSLGESLPIGALCLGGLTPISSNDTSS